MGEEYQVRKYTVFICDGCVGLKGEMCCTPECAFCWMSTKDIKEALKQILVMHEDTDGVVHQVQEGETPKPNEHGFQETPGTGSSVISDKGHPFLSDEAYKDHIGEKSR